MPFFDSLWCFLEQAQSVNLDIKRVVANRYWCNKLWNAIKFAIERLGDDFRPSTQLPTPGKLPLPCRWILSRLNAATEKVVAGFESYSFADGTQVNPLSSPCIEESSLLLTYCQCNDCVFLYHVVFSQAPIFSG